MKSSPLRLLSVVFAAFLAACSTHGPYTGSTTYGGGDEYGVTVYKTIYSTTEQAEAEAILHCKRFDKVARLLSCSSILVNSCTFACDRNVTAFLPPKGNENSSKLRSGSGFFVSDDGHVVTNEHVIRSCNSFTLLRGSESRLEATVVAKDQVLDLALLKVTEKPAHIARFRRGRRIRVGNDIVSFGFPLTGLLSSEGNFSKGSVTALSGIDDSSSMLQISAPLQPGNSGGPLMDYSGNVVGVIVGKLSAVKVAEATGDIPQNVNFAIKQGIVEKFLAGNDVGLEHYKSIETLDAADIADTAKLFTVQIVCW